MNKRAILGLCIAILFPFAGYYAVKYYSAKAVHMPLRYFYDSVGTTTKRGKAVPDTQWHRVRDISLTNQLGRTVTLDSVRNKILVINFFFTKCPSICPGLARSMKKLQDSYANSKDSIVQFISISIDPEHDRPEQLREMRDRYSITDEPGKPRWIFCTGSEAAITSHRCRCGRIG